MGSSVVYVGAGGIGLLLAALSTKASSVALVARGNYQALSSAGKYTIDEKIPPSTREVEIDPSLVLESGAPYNGPKFDFVVVTAKVLHDKALPIKDYLKPESIIILIQNGVDIERPYLETFPNHPVALCTIRIAIELTAPTVATKYSPLLAIAGGLVNLDTPENVKKFELFESLFEDLSFEVSDHVLRDRWEKVLWNGTFNTICSVIDIDLEGLFESGSLPFVKQVMTEIWTVGKAAVGDDWIPKEKIDELLNHTKALAQSKSGFVPSTLQDVRKGKRIEVEAICGNVVKAAKKLDVPVPNLSALYNLLKAVDFKLASKAKAKV